MHTTIHTYLLTRTNTDVHTVGGYRYTIYIHNCSGCSSPKSAIGRHYSEFCLLMAVISSGMFTVDWRKVVSKAIRGSTPTTLLHHRFRWYVTRRSIFRFHGSDNRPGLVIVSRAQAAHSSKENYLPSPSRSMCPMTVILVSSIFYREGPKIKATGSFKQDLGSFISNLGIL